MSAIHSTVVLPHAQIPHDVCMRRLGVLGTAMRTTLFTVLLLCTGYLGYSTFWGDNSVRGSTNNSGQRVDVQLNVQRTTEGIRTATRQPELMLTEPHPKSRPKELRVMFVGDSITEGIAANSHRRFRAPRQGSCSFRYHMTAHALKWAQQHRNSTISFQPVGPFGGVMGAMVPPGHCCEPLLTEARAAYDATHNATSCLGAYGRHAALFGGHVRNLFLREPSDLAAVRARVYTSWFRRPYVSRDFSWTNERTMPSQGAPLPQVGVPRIEAWIRAYQPHVVMVAMGTNDLYTSSSALDLVLSVYPALLSTVLCATAVHRGGSGCPVAQATPGAASIVKAVTLSTLLWRAVTDVEPLNRFLRNIDVCKTTTGVDLEKCAECVSTMLHNSLRDDVDPLHDTTFERIPPLDAAAVYCNARVYVLDAGDGSVVSNTSSSMHMYDGIHPSPLGESLLAEQLWRESLQRGVWEDVLKSLSV